MRHPSLHPIDIPVAIQIAFAPGATYDVIGSAVGVDGATAFRSSRRLEQARFLLSGERRVAKSTLTEFVLHGLRYVFYPVLGAESLGVPTAYSAPPLAEEIASSDVLVWASMEGWVRGQSLQPLYDGAPLLPKRNPRLYHALALVDALRVGRARERTRAAQLLQAMLGEAPEA